MGNNAPSFLSSWQKIKYMQSLECTSEGPKWFQQRIINTQYETDLRQQALLMAELPEKGRMDGWKDGLKEPRHISRLWMHVHTPAPIAHIWISSFLIFPHHDIQPGASQTGDTVLRWSGGAHPSPHQKTCSLSWPLAIRRMSASRQSPAPLEWTFMLDSANAASQFDFYATHWWHSVAAEAK